MAHLFIGVVAASSITFNFTEFHILPTYVKNMTLTNTISESPSSILAQNNYTTTFEVNTTTAATPKTTSYLRHSKPTLPISKMKSRSINRKSTTRKVWKVRS